MKDLIKTGVINSSEVITEKEEYIIEDRLEQYVYSLLANYCMPTLAHLKSSSLVSIEKSKLKNTKQLIKFMENCVRAFACSCLCLYENEVKLSLLIYNDRMLSELLTDMDIVNYFIQSGYKVSENCISSVLTTWKQRYSLYFDNRGRLPGYEFPHEIGLLLGYPLKDVIGFIQNKGMNYLLCGYWKVYHDKERAERIFEAYTNVRMNALRLLKEGKTLTDI